MRTGSVVIRRKAEQVAEAGLRIEYLAKAGANKETLVTDSTPEGWGLPDQGLCFVRVPTHRRPGPCPKISRRTAQRKAARYPGSTGAPVLPGGQYLNMSFRWTFHPAEYATDILFRQRQDLICMRR